MFNLDRVTSLPKYAHKSNFLHPVIYFYSNLPQINSINIINLAKSKHHIIEDFLTFWNKPGLHQLHFRRFIEYCLKNDYKRYSTKKCLNYHAIYGSYPTGCNINFNF